MSDFAKELKHMSGGTIPHSYGAIEEIAEWAVGEIERLSAEGRAYIDALKEIHWHMGDKDVPDHVRNTVCYLIDETLPDSASGRQK